MRRWHRLLAVLVGLPILLWTFTGFVMSARPISEVRGDDLVRAAPPVVLERPPVVPAVGGLPIQSLTLEPRAGGPLWVVRIEGVPQPRLADPATGAWRPAYGAAEASREVLARYTGTSAIASVNRVARGENHHELNDPIDGWRVRLADGTNFYVESGSGKIVAHRSGYWRFYDFLWGLHIMDLQGREDPHNPWIVMLSAISLLVITLGLAMLPATLRRPPEPVIPPRAGERAEPANRD
jgi:hypothetical protein